MQKFILIGSVVYGILLYSIIKLIPFSNNIKAITSIILTILLIYFLKMVDNNLKN